VILFIGADAIRQPILARILINRGNNASSGFADRIASYRPVVRRLASTGKQPLACISCR